MKHFIFHWYDTEKSFVKYPISCPKAGENEWTSINFDFDKWLSPSAILLRLLKLSSNNQLSFVN